MAASDSSSKTTRLFGLMRRSSSRSTDANAASAAKKLSADPDIVKEMEKLNANDAGKSRREKG